jgi:hypothetical protein
MKKIGATFRSELETEGLLGLPFTWNEDGDFMFTTEPNDLGTVPMTQAQVEAVLQVYNAHDPARAAAPFVPESVTKYQCCVVLARHDLLDATTEFFSAMAADDPRRLAWEMAPTVLRNGDATLAAAAHHGLSPAQVDSMFIEAGQVGG